LGVHEKRDPFATKGKALMVKEFQDLASLVDSSGLCLFAILTPDFGVEDVRSMLHSVTGFDYTPQEVQTACERIWNLERLFNLQAGFTSADDTLPKRLLEEPLLKGGPKGRVCRLGEMLPEYYALRGWDKAGVPTEEKLAQLGLGKKFKS